MERRETHCFTISKNDYNLRLEEMKKDMTYTVSLFPTEVTPEDVHCYDYVHTALYETEEAGKYKEVFIYHLMAEADSVTCRELGTYVLDNLQRAKLLTNGRHRTCLVSLTPSRLQVFPLNKQLPLNTFIPNEEKTDQ